ncbi:MAG: amidohydrolase family protein [Candidatus Eremiobacteraeota bacterium]|nr:amidohydrolase family protein [Candidatus Eremiobacteraeota bacterium]
MFRYLPYVAGALLFCATPALADSDAPAPLAPAVQSFVRYSAPVIAIKHVRVIDGTGAAARESQTLVIKAGRIASVGPDAAAAVPAGAAAIDGTGRTIMPGLVGMHDHLFYLVGDQPVGHAMYVSFPRMYLAGGVTTIRTAGSMEPYADLNLKRAIDDGRVPGPHIDVSGPYISGPRSRLYMDIPRTPREVTEAVNYYADIGVTSFKAYAFVTKASLAALITAAHKRGIKVAGHLCSVTFHDAISLGIDSLEHGIEVATDFDAGKQPDICPAGKEHSETLRRLDIESEPVRRLIEELVSHHVAITSTLAVYETGAPDRFPPQQRMLDSLDAQARLDYLATRNEILADKNNPSGELLKKEMRFERYFVKAGGLLMAGADPTGYGGSVAGFADQRNLELLVEAGFSPEQAIKIATANGAQFEGKLASIGTIATGKNADLVLIDGNPAANIADVEKVDTVFKDGIGYDSAKIFKAMEGQVGRQ